MNADVCNREDWFDGYDDLVMRSRTRIARFIKSPAQVQKPARTLQLALSRTESLHIMANIIPAVLAYIIRGLRTRIKNIPSYKFIIRIRTGKNFFN